ncbi:hypothetical protein BHM03_00039573, partial [Ensete ventricosum]
GKQVPSCTAIQAMASKLTSPASVMGALPHFNGLKVQPSTVALPQPKQRGRGALGARCDFIGSSTNIVSTVTLNNNGGEHKLDVVRGEVRVGSVGEQEGHDRAEAGSPRLGAADRRPCRVHLGGHVGLRHRRPHHRRRRRLRPQELGRHIRRSLSCPCCTLSLFALMYMVSSPSKSYHPKPVQTP